MERWPHEGSLSRIVSGHANRRFGKASKTSIEAYERTYRTALSDDYKQFLLRENGLIYDTGDYPEDRTLLNFAGEDVSKTLGDMNTFYGIGNLDRDTDLLLLTPRTIADSRKFLPFCNWIGLGGDLCEWAEVNQGKYRNWIFYTDGEIQLHYLKTDIENKSPDQVVDEFVKAGFFMPVARSFGELLDLYAKYFL